MSPTASRKEPFPFLFMLRSALEQEPSSPIFLFFVGLFLYVRNTSMLSPSIIRYLLQYHHRAASTQRCTAQRGQPAQQAAKQVRADQSATTQACRRSWLVQACRRPIYSSLCSVFSKQRNRNLLGLQKYCWWCDAQRVRLYAALSLPPFFFVHTCGVRVVFGDNGALSICKSLLCTENPGPLGAIQSFAFCSILLCERA